MPARLLSSTVLSFGLYLRIWERSYMLISVKQNVVC